MRSIPEFEELLSQFQSKARCAHSQRKAKQVWNQLEEYLVTIPPVPEWRSRMLTAWGHVDVEGPGDLDQTCADVRRAVTAWAKATKQGQLAALRRHVE